MFSLVFVLFCGVSLSVRASVLPRPPLILFRAPGLLKSIPGDAILKISIEKRTANKRFNHQVDHSSNHEAQTSSQHSTASRKFIHKSRSYLEPWGHRLQGNTRQQVWSSNTVIDYSVLVYTSIYYSILYDTVLYYTIRYCTVPCCTVLYYTIT